MALNKMDRCDRCQAQAYVSVTNTPNHVPSLYFCGHHFSDAWPYLLAQSFDVVDDERYQLELAEAGHSQGGAHA